MMQEMFGNSYLFGANAPFIEELYDAYLENPESVDGAWRQYFDALQKTGNGPDVSHERVRETFAVPTSSAGRRQWTPRRRSSRSRCCN